MKLTTMGDKIRVLRSIKGFSQSGLAVACGLKQGQISYLEKSKNKKECDPEILDKICLALNTSLIGITNFGTDYKNYISTIKKLNKEETEIYNSLDTEQDLVEKLFATLNVLFKVNENYTMLLDKCEKKLGPGVKAA